VCIAKTGKLVEVQAKPASRLPTGTQSQHHQLKLAGCL
jgi:hypothetical protein